MSVINTKALAALGTATTTVTQKKTGLAEATLAVTNRFYVFARIAKAGIEKYVLDNGTVSHRISALFADENGETKEATMIVTTTRVIDDEPQKVEANIAMMKTITANLNKPIMFEVSVGKKDTNKGMLYPWSCEVVKAAAKIEPTENPVPDNDEEY